MNFQIRWFGTKEEADLDCLTQYLTTLSEFTMMLVKSGEQHLRDTTVHVLAAWNRILIELKAQEVSWEQKIKELIDDIIVEYIEQTISDMTDDNEEDDDEQFNESELNSLNQRFDVIARFCNHNIDSAFSRINDGLSYLMSRYEIELKDNNKDQLEIIEIRFSWTIRLISALMNLGTNFETFCFFNNSDFCQFYWPFIILQVADSLLTIFRFCTSKHNIRASKRMWRDHQNHRDHQAVSPASNRGY